MIKHRAIPKEELQAEEFLSRLWQETKISVRKLIKWIFFYKPTDNVDAFIHILGVVAWLYLGIFIVSH